MGQPVRPKPKLWAEVGPTNIPKHPWKGFGNLRFSCFASGPFCWHTVLRFIVVLPINFSIRHYVNSIYGMLKFNHYVLCIILINQKILHFILYRFNAQFAKHFPITMKFWQICMYSITVIFLKCWPFFTWHFGRPKLWQASSRFLNKSINALLQEVSNFCVTRSRRCMYI